MGVEGIITEIVKELLKIDNVDPEVDLTDYGFNSLQMSLFVSKLQKKTNYNLTLRDIFQHRTIKNISSSIEKNQ